MSAGAGSLTGKQLGDFQLQGLLGAGGMAEVYRGFDVKLKRPVAVKVLPATLASDPNYVQRFRTEAQRVAACWYTGQTFMIDIGVTDGATHRLAMYLLDWDGYGGGRVERIVAVNATTGKLLDSRTVGQAKGDTNATRSVPQRQVSGLAGARSCALHRDQSEFQCGSQRYLF